MNYSSEINKNITKFTEHYPIIASVFMGKSKTLGWAMKQKKRKSINLESKVLIQKLKAIDERIDLLLSEQQEWGKERIKSINKLNEITRKINDIESNILLLSDNVQ